MYSIHVSRRDGRYNFSSVAARSQCDRPLTLLVEKSATFFFRRLADVKPAMMLVDEVMPTPENVNVSPQGDVFVLSGRLT